CAALGRRRLRDSPHSATERGGDDARKHSIVPNVGDDDVRYSRPEALPALTLVARVEDALIGADEDHLHAFDLRDLDGIDREVRKVAVDGLPGIAPVARDPHLVRAEGG